MSITASPQSETALAHAIIECIRDNALDDAENLVQQLNEAYPATRRHLIFPVMIAIQRGRAHDAWQLVNGLPDDEAAPLKALCLRRLGDPSWHSYATANLEHPDRYVRRAMRSLLGCPKAGDIHALLR